jgi:hypothetical protein
MKYINIVVDHLVGTPHDRYFQYFDVLATIVGVPQAIFCFLTRGMNNRLEKYPGTKNICYWGFDAGTVT